jgi:chromosome partitioning protein
MNIITLLNEKGGVGKTTLARHIAAGLAIKGQRVVLIDADAQGHSTTQFQLKKQPGLHDLLVREAEWKDMLRPVLPSVYSDESPKGELWVLPSNVETRVIPMLVDDAKLLWDRLSDIDGWANVVVIDTSPTPSLLHAMIYLATDWMLYPTQCEMMSLEGLRDSIDHLEKRAESKVLFGLSEAKMMGIQPTMYDVRTNAHDYGLGLLRDKFHRLAWNALPTRTIWRDAAFALKTVFAYDTPDTKAKDKVLEETWALIDRVERTMAS